MKYSSFIVQVMRIYPGEQILTNCIKHLIVLGSTSSQVQSICDAHDIPHIQTRWDLVHSMNKFSVNLMPSPILLSQVKVIYFDFDQFIPLTNPRN